ncbi:MAG TPA: polysaccharide biosynthesis tyrosine autokinase [Pyrinomonadaceae bacterium]|jgi:capsular exopolysaccharide synthesis family protein|nr:polysaccharide biosynthesis tyrosine autokinase [Pyrinomonadaceae bacterium]
MMSQDNRLLPLSSPVDRSLDRPLSEIPQTKPGYGATITEPTHLREYLNVVLKRKWLILSLVLVVTLLVTIQMYRMPSIYEAATTIQIEPKRESVLKTGKEIVINTGNTKDPAYINTQLRLLENPTLARQVIKTLDLQNNPAFFGGQSQTGFIASLRRIFSLDKKADASKSDSQAAVPVVTETEVKDVQLTLDEMERLEPYEMTLAANLTVEPIAGTNLVTLKYRHSNPELTQKIVNTLADTFIYNNIERETSGTQNAYKVLSEKIAELQLTIRRQEEQRVNYAQRNNVPIDDKPSSNLPAERLAMLSTQLLQAENERKNLQSLYEASAKETDPNSIPEVQDSKRVQELRTKLDTLKQKREELLQVYTAEWPEVKKIDAQIKPLEESLTKAPREVVAAMRTRFEAALAKEARLRSSYHQQLGETRGQNIAGIQLSQMSSDLETNRQNYNLLRARLNEIENTTTEKPNNISVTNAARTPREPVGPPRLRTIILAFLLSLGAGIGLAFLLDYLDDTLKTVDDVDRYLHLPSLALIPSRHERPRLKGRRAVAAGDGADVTALALTSDVRSPIAEAYRHLRTSLLLSSAGQPPKTILVTSSQPSEGKTTTAINTAIMLAQTGADVLLVDCDLRRPRIHANFGVSNARGLTNYLSGERDLAALLQEYDKLPNLKLLTSGPIPPNPAELLGSNEMRRLLGTLGERFTHIVIDSPPAISFTDASILSTLVDGVMLVVHGGRSSRAVVRRARQQLVDVGANIFGVVLNNVKLESSDYYYYSGYYSNHYDDDGAPDPTDGASTAGAGRAS